MDEYSGLITLKYNIIDSEFAAYRNYRVSTRYRPVLMSSAHVQIFIISKQSFNESLDFDDCS